MTDTRLRLRSSVRDDIPSVVHFTEPGGRAGPGDASRCDAGMTGHIGAQLNYTGNRMKSVSELLELFMRQAELEKAMRQPGGARVTEEQELLAVREKLASARTSSRAVHTIQGES